MNQLSLIYENENIATKIDGDDIYFKSSDVYKYLGVSQSTWNDHLRSWSELYVEKSVVANGANGRVHYEYWLTEAGLYRACSIGKTEMCEKFRDWVFADVLPSIRKDGAYIADKDKYAMSMKAITMENKNMKKAISCMFSKYFEAGRQMLSGKKHYKEPYETLAEGVFDMERVLRDNHYEFWKENNPTFYGLDDKLQ